MNLLEAHEHSNRNRNELSKSNLCGCFYCLKIFKPNEITEYVDKGSKDVGGETALCPYCSIDAVIGDASGFDLTPAFLAVMYEHSFRPRKELTESDKKSIEQIREMAKDKKFNFASSENTSQYQFGVEMILGLLADVMETPGMAKAFVSDLSEIGDFWPPNWSPHNDSELLDDLSDRIGFKVKKTDYIWEIAKKYEND